MATKLTVLANGSLRVEGNDFELVDTKGPPYGLGGRERISICRCGLSAQKPFCDGSHRQTNFRAPAGGPPGRD